MVHSKKLIISRRTALVGLSATMTSTHFLSSLEAAEHLLRTPSQSEGPFYPESWKGDVDNDLVTVKGAAAQSMGQVLHLTGKVFDVSGYPIASALIEIWQCDTHGIYRHSEDESPTQKHDQGFQGYGRVLTDEMGRYSFRTIKPVPYPGRTPHIHFRVKVRNRPVLTTQMYIFGEPENARDVLLNDIRNKKRRDSLIVKLSPADRLEVNALGGMFNIVLG